MSTYFNNPLSNRTFSKYQLLHRAVARLERRMESARQLSKQFVRWRAIVMLVGIGVGFSLYQTGQALAANILFALFVVAFVLLVYFHSRLKGALLRLEHWVGIKRAHLARLQLDWAALPPSREYSVPDRHPYAHDLDMVGNYSLLRLLDTTVSTKGHSLLASALLSPPMDLTQIEQQQRLVKELIPRSLLCDRIVLEAKSITSGEINSEEMIASLQSSEPPRHVGMMLALEGCLAILTMFFFVLEHGFQQPRYWSYTFVAYVLVYFIYSGQLALVFGRAQALRSHLERLSGLFRLLERRKEHEAPLLRTLLSPFHQPGGSPSVMIRKASRICNALSIKANPLVHIALNAVGPWDLYFAFRYQKVRRAILGLFETWLDTLGKLEASCALAKFAALHPEYIFPTFGADEQGRSSSPRIIAKGIGHPLIQAAKRVTNDFTLDGLGSVALLTGSNMSGKSTFLRTIGINTCLAHAGAPVCAQFFSSPLLQVFCSLRIKDDLEEGLSYFYAEVKRLRQIWNATQNRSGPSVLFLIDEIFKGTNNRERIIGSTYYLKSLVEGNGLGLVTTHDLELAALATESQWITNYHFQEAVSNGQLVFDYRLRTGSCPTTNALRIMALEGLPVPRTET